MNRLFLCLVVCSLCVATQALAAMPVDTNQATLFLQGSRASQATDLGLGFEYQRRFDRHWGMPFEISTLLGRVGAAAIGSARWYPTGALPKIGYEDYVQLGAGAIFRKVLPLDPADTTTPAKGKIGPVLTLQYGRDILPWKGSTLGFRFSMFGLWAFGDVLARTDWDGFIPMTHLGNIMFGIKFGCFWE